MGIAKFVGTAIGKKAGKIGGHAPDVEWINGMPVVRHSFEEWISWLANGEEVSKDFIWDVIKEAVKRKDFDSLQVIYRYLIRYGDYFDDNALPMLKVVLENGRMLKVLQQIGNPFINLIESVVDYL